MTAVMVLGTAVMFSETAVGFLEQRQRSCFLVDSALLFSEYMGFFLWSAHRYFWMRIVMTGSEAPPPFGDPPGGPSTTVNTIHPVAHHNAKST
jgi:hypothetical protein